MSVVFSIPAFDNIFKNGAPHAVYAILFPKLKSSPSSFLSVTFSLASSNATPPPGSNPSSSAALVACKASSIRSFFSLISVSVAPPMLITATPPTNLPKRSCKCSFSNAGLLQRQNWINYSVSSWADGLASSSVNNQASLLANGSNGFNSTFTNYIQRSATSRAIVIDAIVRLKDVADFFQKAPLLKGSTMRLYINTNQTYFTLGLVNPVI